MGEYSALVLGRMCIVVHRFPFFCKRNQSGLSWLKSVYVIGIPDLFSKYFAVVKAIAEERQEG